MPDNDLLDEIISSQPEFGDDDDELSDEAMEEMDDANVPCCTTL
ncbi:hypothetical protein RSAG8_08051, partial [Rhizoctonia solani AG-8 WAC10335]